MKKHVKAIIKDMFIKLLSIKQCIYYVLDYSALKGRKSHKLRYIDRFSDCQLFLVPHADDDLLGGYALAKFQKDKFIYGYYGLTGSNSDPQNREIRDNEFQCYCEAVGIPFFTISNTSDLKQLLNSNDIRVVYLPSIFDWHPEHRKLNYDLLELINSDSNFDDLRVIWYSVTIPIVSSKAMMVPMSKKEQKEKYDLFAKNYISQNHMPVKRFAYQEQLNADGTSDYSSEVFCPVELKTWKGIVGSFMNNEPDGACVDQLNKLKSKIDRLKIIRFESHRLYQKYVE